MKYYSAIEPVTVLKTKSGERRVLSGRFARPSPASLGRDSPIWLSPEYCGTNVDISELLRFTVLPSSI